MSTLFGQLDVNKDKRISFAEFKKGHELIGHSHVSEKQLKEEFHRIDTNNGGYILFDEVCLCLLANLPCISLFF